MKSFTFPLEIVLQARATQETEASRQLAIALDQQREAAARAGEAVQVMNRLLEIMASESAGRFSVANRERSWTVRAAQEKICADLRAAAQASVRLTEEKRAAVLVARRQRELLERLKAARLAAWQKEAAHAEQHQFDEFAMTRRHQAAQQEYALC